MPTNLKCINHQVSHYLSSSSSSSFTALALYLYSVYVLPTEGETNFHSHIKQKVKDLQVLLIKSFTRRLQ